MNAGTALSTYIPASQSTLDVCSHHPNLCIKNLCKSQPAACSIPHWHSTSAVFAPAALPPAKVACFYALTSNPAAYKIHNWPRPRKRKRLLQTVLSKVPRPSPRPRHHRPALPIGSYRLAVLIRPDVEIGARSTNSEFPG